MITSITVASFVLALIPALLFLRNLRLYAPLPRQGVSRAGWSVLIPARNEESTIADALHSVLRSREVDLEVIVMDDGSTDRTADIVRAIAAADPRVRPRSRACR